ncbi:MAG: M23 family metallopeptidase [Ilumatobacteraceae bacterium]
MFDVRWLTRFGAVIVLIAAGPGGVIQAAIAAIDEAAQVSEWADRGPQFPAGETPRPTSTPYVPPVADAARASWSNTHSTYPATDIFVGCGAELVSPVAGVALEVRRVNAYDPAVDNPATRGGRSVAILGDDGVRYYLAHFDAIVAALEPGDLVAPGQVIGTMGQTGRASACHVHFSISPPCPGKEWAVRRGVVWPYGYLTAWRAGEQRSPAAEVQAWADANPNACAEAMADPFASDA